jgi:regulator of protease activity HflC (stomatin/prohibitin superfamily)
MMQERKASGGNGFIGLLVMFLLLVIGLVALFSAPPLGILLIILGLVAWTSFVVVQPNQACVVTFFGKYLGSIREPGIWWTIPLSGKRKVSLRVRNFNSKQLKVNDVDGNPIEIAAVVVFRVTDSAKALFEVDNYEQFVEIQSETALRHITTYYPYDTYGENGLSLRGNSDEVADVLKLDLQRRLQVAGVEVIETRLTHLAYSPEIAHAMLQRQQATAILAARQLIVDGAVGMVHSALQKMEAEGIVEMDQQHKAAMVNNLLVAIVSERGAQPVINAGS